MYLNEDGHVTWQGIGQYTGLPEMKKFLETFSENATNIKQLKTIVRYKEIFEEEMDKFTPRPEYGTALFKQAYLAARHRTSTEAV